LSYLTLGRGGYDFQRDFAHFVWKNYQRTEEDQNNPYFTPFKAKSLAGLPRALIIESEHDCSKDDGLMYSARLKLEGVPVVTVTYSDMPHDHYLFDVVFPRESKMVIEQISAFINLE